MRYKVLAPAIVAAVAAVGTAVPATAAPTTHNTSPIASYCARKFDQAQRTDMESYRDFDRETWIEGHDDDAISIYNNGTWVQGRDAIAASQNAHFTNRNAVWTWTELTRAVDGCSTASIVYDATYAIPSQNFSVRLIINVTYTFKRGKWFSVIDQGTGMAA
jgi:hypothetical protein